MTAANLVLDTWYMGPSAYRQLQLVPPLKRIVDHMLVCGIMSLFRTFRLPTEPTNVGASSSRFQESVHPSDRFSLTH